MTSTRLGFALVIASLGLGAVPALAFDWSGWADIQVIEVVTHDEDGSLRQTKAWILVQDGQAYIRTGGTTWGENITREPSVVVLGDPGEVHASVTFVEDEAERERVFAAFREKYGFSDALMSPFRGSHPKLMRLDAGDSATSGEREVEGGA